MENKYSIFEEPRDRPKVIECANYLDSLFSRAFSKEPFGVLCTLLRLNGLQDQNWDPFEESMKMFGDYNWLREKAKKANSDTCANRIALLIYCHAIEMTAPHEMLSNLLRCLGGKSYVVKPFGHLTRVNKKQSFSWVPPSAKMKFRELKSQANDAKEEQLANYIDNFFNDDIRNAVSHSDYIITPDAFRFTESGLPRQIPNEKLSETINNGFAFYDALSAEQKATLDAGFAQFTFAAQTVTDSGDPIAYVQALAATQTPTHLIEVVGNGVDNLSDQTVTNRAPFTPMGGTEPAIAFLGLQGVSEDTNGSGAVRFVNGHHSSILDPRPTAASPDAELSARATQEMQTQVATFFASMGQLIKITDSAVVKQ